VLQACLAAAATTPGLFSLTVPTGGGKTLSGLAFALKHAAAHNLRRVIYVAPYLSILDQNARVLRQALGFGPDAPELFEHHSLAEPPGDEGADETASRAAVRRAESWDAPVIITTNVQFFESLFSNRPGRCRKLHNIARSVVLLDECQCLPPELVAPTCSVLGQLAGRLGCSLVLCTATQPAFDHADMPERLIGVREIIPAGLALFSRLRRVGVEWPADGTALDWVEVAGRMREQRAALCIVNTKGAARDLFTELSRHGGDVFHLSTAMCPAHRLAVLDAVQARLKSGRRCYLVSTQLIEAGVDVDFPFVMRELAPLEAIIQAAGRCNREGRLKAADGSPGGRVVVFRSTGGGMPPDRWYRAGRQILEASFLNNARKPRIDHLADVREYFERLYRSGSLDGRAIQDDRRALAFASVAAKYRLIDDEGLPVVVASWKEKRDQVEDLLQDVRTRPTRAAFRRLTPFQVNLRTFELTKMGAWAAEEASGLWVWRGGYDSSVGVTADHPDTLFVV
jgi:CRISPR-associated endonuclease/helicase Cas3